MRSWSIPVGRLFGVDVRVHLTFLILPLFIFWTESVAHQGVANGPRDLALVGIILASVAAHEFGHILAARRYGLIPKAVILLPLTGVTLFDETHGEKPAACRHALETRDSTAVIGPLVNVALAALTRCYRDHHGARNPAVEVAIPAVGQFAAQRGLGQPLSGGPESDARLSA